MKGLLIKDIKLIVKQKKFFLMAIMLAALFTWTSDDVTFAATYLILLLSMLTLTTISYDDMNGGMLFLLSLPTNRKMYVKEKYVFAFVNLVFAAGLSLAVCFGFATIKGQDIPFDNLISSIIGIMVAMGVMLAVTIPLEIKYGPEKGRMAVLAVAVVIALIGVGGYKLLTEVLHVDVKGVAAKLLGKLPDTGINTDVIIIGVLLVVLILLLSISYLVSNKIMKKKEF